MSAMNTCPGCLRGYPTRPCAITGEPVHRGPDASFSCTAPRRNAKRVCGRNLTTRAGKGE